MSVYETRHFRLFLLLAVAGVAAIGLIAFEIIPKMRANEEMVAQAAKTAPVYVPKVPGDPNAPVDVRMEGMLDKVKDSTSIDDRDEAYAYLVRHLARAEAATVAKEAKRVDYKLYGKIPEELRGQPVRILALFLKSNPIRLEKKVGDVEWVHRTYLLSNSGNEGYVVDLLNPPGDVRREALVVTNGIFLRLGTYEGGKGVVQAPLFLGKSLDVVRDETSANATSGAIMVVSAVGGVILVIFLVVQLWPRSRGRQGLGSSVQDVDGAQERVAVPVESGGRPSDEPKKNVP
jgi:hypothetical protein